MASYQLTDVLEVEARNGIFRALTDRLGVAGFRINQLELAPGAEGLEHDHIENDQEEVYAVVAGSGVLRMGGEAIPLHAGHFIHLAPDATGCGSGLPVLAPFDPRLATGCHRLRPLGSISAPSRRHQNAGATCRSSAPGRDEPGLVGVDDSLDAVA